MSRPTHRARRRWPTSQLAIAIALVVAAATAAAVALADDLAAAGPAPARIDRPEQHASAKPHAAAIPDVELTGEDIYRRVLENRFDSYKQSSKMVSGDRSGTSQRTELDMWFRNFRDAQDRPDEGGVLSKALVRYTAPFDLRHSGYLVINKLDEKSDQFVYRASTRRIQRVSLRGEAVFGTDFSFEDVVPRELDDATYERREDVEWEERPCFVVRAIPKPNQESEYAYFEVTVEKERFIPLRTRYWDEAEVEVKQLVAPVDRYEVVRGIWVPMHLEMTHLRRESTTVVDVVEIIPNIELARTHFELRRLEGH